ncbi:hypothetical protein K435DRAFT_875653 [Dendrothele bispora CBS 962.96]|uniref:Uncharacterized protein n=1 Tax=Dendrothele bispora (strain CBS 962.96) TaxID=1314807 RepID=A0A4V4HBG4_DENBC|nr:hypothetical protein K435DRAFT_875653 [Dendrothele bispora CBS 962.96]
MAPLQFDPKAMVDFDSLWPRGLFPDAPISLPPIPFPKLPPPLPPQQAENFSTAPRFPPLPPQIHLLALLESPPKNQKLGKTTARRAPRPGQPNSHVMGNDTSITITIPGVWINMGSDVEVEVNGSENSSLDGNLEVDENSSKEESLGEEREEESSGEEENSDSDEESE